MNQDYNSNPLGQDNAPQNDQTQAERQATDTPNQSTDNESRQNTSSVPSGNEAYDQLMRGNGYSGAWQSDQPASPSSYQASGTQQAQQSQTVSAQQQGSAQQQSRQNGYTQQSGYAQQGAYQQQNQNSYGTGAYGYGYGSPYGGQYAPNGGYGYQSAYNTQGQYQTNQPAPGKKKKYATRTALVWTLIVCLLFSLLCGGAGFVAGRVTSGNTSIPGIIHGGGTVNINNYTADPAVPSKADGTVAGVVTAVSESVVEISTETVSTGTAYGQYITSGAGSGVIIDTQGYIITCNHVIEGASKITVKLTNGNDYEATVVGSDSETDIAVIRIDAGSATLKAAEFADSDALAVGQEIVVIGNPLGSLGGSVTNGIISATGREIEIEGQMYTLLQTNAAINPGNSGGGMFDMNGRLVGIVNAKSSGSDIEGLGFAIPSKNAKDVASQLIAYGYIKGRVKIGIQCFEVQSQEDYMQWWKYSKYITDYGVYIAESENKSFETGDRIIAFDGTEISTFSDLKALLSKCEVGQKVTITVSRLNTATGKSQLMQIEVELTEKTPN